MVSYLPIHHPHCPLLMKAWKTCSFLIAEQFSQPVSCLKKFEVPKSLLSLKQSRFLLAQTCSFFKTLWIMIYVFDASQLHLSKSTVTIPFQIRCSILSVTLHPSRFCGSTSSRFLENISEVLTKVLTPFAQFGLCHEDICKAHTFPLISALKLNLNLRIFFFSLTSLLFISQPTLFKAIKQTGSQGLST